MRITEISFCDKVGYNIRSDETKKHILDSIEQKYNIKIVAKHFEKYDGERSQRILNNNPHMMCVRSNGNPYFLVFTRHNFNDIALFIDKKVQQGYFLPRMIISHIMLGKNGDIHNDTIFDGEMVKKKDGKWLYLINDLIVLKGQHMQHLNLIKRLNIAYKLLEKEYLPDEISQFRVAIKKYYTYDEAKQTLEIDMETLPYTCRGVYFRPLYMKFKDILVNFDDSLVKKVKREKYGTTFMLEANNTESTKSEDEAKDQDMIETRSNTGSSSSNVEKTFFTRKTASPDVYELLDNNNKVIGVACINTMKLSKKMRELFAEKNLVDRIELPYEFNDKFNKWVPLLA